MNLLLFLVAWLLIPILTYYNKKVVKSNVEIWYINQHTNKVIFDSKIAKSKNEDWIISNNYSVTVLDLNGNPIPNSNFKTEDEKGNHVEISENNLPYLTQRAFDRFSEFRVGTGFSLSMRQLWNMSVLADDANGYFDEKEVHKTLLETQKELYNT